MGSDKTPMFNINNSKLDTKILVKSKKNGGNPQGFGTRGQKSVAYTKFYNFSTPISQRKDIYIYTSVRRGRDLEILNYIQRH